MRDYVEGLAINNVNNVPCTYLIHGASPLIIEVHSLVINSYWLTPIIFLPLMTLNVFYSLWEDIFFKYKNLSSHLP